MLIDFRTLWPKYNIHPSGVVHIGGNVGEEYPVYMELGVTKQLWFEPNIEMFTQLNKTIINNHEAISICCCLGEEDKDVVLHISNNAGQSSSILELGTHAEVHPDVSFIKDVPVQMRRYDSLMEEIKLDGYDFLNIDVQGYELHVLKGMGDLLNNFKWAYLEVNKAELYRKCALIEDIDEYLANFGFDRVETYWAGNTNWGDALYCKVEG